MPTRKYSPLLIAWSMIMAVWMNADRVRSLGRANIKPEQIKVGARGSDLAAIAPEVRDWPAHNYNHLMEQPTVFYAASVILALSGATALDAGLAWSYVALRIIHSLWQATINTLQIRSKWLYWLLAPMLRWQLRRVARKSMARAKAIVEAQVRAKAAARS